MKKAFIFDFDGTLAETFPLIFKAVDAAYEKLGLVPPSKEVVFAHFGPHELGLLREISPERADEIFAEYLAATSKIINSDGLRAFGGLEEILSEMKAAGYKLAVLTGKSRESLQLTLEAIGLSKYFDLLKWGGEHGSVKPQRLREVLAEFKMSADEVFYVGDSVQDIKDCRSAGVDILAAAWAACADASALAAEHPCAVLTSVFSLRGYFKTREGA